jgi:hypothetical protein
VTVENEAVDVFIPVGIVTVDFHDFGYEPPAGATFQVHDDVYGVTDVCLDGTVWQLDTCGPQKFDSTVFNAM